MTCNFHLMIVTETAGIAISKQCSYFLTALEIQIPVVKQVSFLKESLVQL